MYALQAPMHVLETLAAISTDPAVMLALALPGAHLLARSLRLHGLHWSWAAAGLAPTLALAPLSTAIAAPLAVTFALAARRGRRWHRLDLESGGDLAAIARARSAPVDALIAGLPPRGRGDRRSAPSWEPRTTGHTLIVGATGSGKTVTQTLLAAGAVERGSAAIVVDPKGDADMRERMRDAAERAGRDFLEWTPQGPCVYNPYARGGETEIADRVLAGEQFTEPHYLRQAQRYLGHVTRTMRAAGREVALGEIVRLLDPRELECELRELPAGAAEEGQAYLDSLSPRQLRDLAGVRDRLAILSESEVGRWLDPATAGRRFDLLQVARAGAVAYLRLEADSRPLLAQMLGAAVVQDLQSAVAALQGAPAPTTVVLDEFSAIAAERVVALFGRARSAGFSLLLGTQELSDLRLAANGRLLDQVMGNLSFLVAHRQVVPSSAELLSRLAGTRGTWRVSWSSDGRSTRTRTSEPLVPAEALARLAPGHALLISLAGPASSGLVRIASPRLRSAGDGVGSTRKAG